MDGINGPPQRNTLKYGCRQQPSSLLVEPVHENRVAELFGAARSTAGLQPDVVDGPAAGADEGVTLQSKADLQRAAIRGGGQADSLRLPFAAATARMDRIPGAAAVDAVVDVAEIPAGFRSASIVEAEGDIAVAAQVERVGEGQAAVEGS